MTGRAEYQGPLVPLMAWGNYSLLDRASQVTPRTGLLGDIPVQLPIQNAVDAFVGNGTGIRSAHEMAWYGFAVKNDGTIWAWGDNKVGELGNGRYGKTAPGTALTPVQTLSRFAGKVRTIAARNGATLILTK